MTPSWPAGWPVLDVRLALVVLHVGTGALALVVGPVLFARRKGDRPHRRLGRVFVWLMAVACATATALLAWRFNPFLAGVTALSAYSVVTAWRAVHWRRAGRPQVIDAALAWLGLAAGAAMAGVGAVIGAGRWPGGPDDLGSRLVIAALALGFGAVVAVMARGDLARCRAAEVAPLAWLDVHMARIIGAYIALCTAFAVQLAGLLLPGAWQWVAWVAPGVIGGRVLAPPFARRERARWVGAAAPTADTSRAG